MDTTIKALIMKIASVVYAIVVNGRSSVAIDAASTKTMQVEQRTNHNYLCVEGSKHLFCPQRDPSVCEVSIIRYHLSFFLVNDNIGRF